MNMPTPRAQVVVSFDAIELDLIKRYMDKNLIPSLPKAIRSIVLGIIRADSEKGAKK